MFCKQVKEFLSEQNVPYEDKDITKDPEALRELTGRLKLRTTPVITLGKDVVVGMDRARLQEFAKRVKKAAA